MIIITINWKLVSAVYPTSSHAIPQFKPIDSFSGTKVKVTVTINRKLFSAQYHEFP